MTKMTKLTRLTEYRAGDFTSGKMNEIFKGASNDYAVVINHKQLGQYNLIIEEMIVGCCLEILSGRPDLFKRLGVDFTNPLEIIDCGAEYDLSKANLKHDTSSNEKTKHEVIIASWIELLTVLTSFINSESEGCKWGKNGNCNR